ncbi:tetratricopeptide repeat protein [Enterovirga rhinocerotis]|nr:tetratricopeptide repeat protein [Enterovirga rhinocerotis]
MPLSALLISACLFGAPQPAFAQGRPDPGKVPPPPSAPAKPEAATKPASNAASTLDELYGRLAAAKDADEAKGIASLIERRLARSGSDTADLLLSRAMVALTSKDGALAVELLDRVTVLRPGWAEAWTRRAVAFWQLDDPSRAMMDLEEALTREPRHFVAWTLLGRLETASGDKARALAAYRRALKIHPFLDDAEKAEKRLAPEVDGRDL